MKKLYIFIIILAISTLVFGKISYNQKIKAQGEKSYKEYQADLKKEQQEKQELINSLDPDKNKNLSFVDYLQYNMLKKNEAKITVFGSSVTLGSGATDRAHSWSGLLGNKLASSIPDAKNLTLTNHGVAGYSTNDIIKHNVLDSVIKDKPDLIIFETSLLNNNGQSLTIDETLNDINMIVTRLTNELPDAKIILMSPNPSTSKKNTTATNKVYLSYEDYLTSVKKYATENGWYYFDAYTVINKSVSDKKLSLDKLLVSDGDHPNDVGYEIWFEALYDYLNQKQVNL